MRSEEAFGSPASDCSEGQKKERRMLRERGRERLRLVALPRQRPAEHGVGRVEEALRVVEVAAAQQIEDGKDQRLGKVTAPLMKDVELKRERTSGSTKRFCGFSWG